MINAIVTSDNHLGAYYARMRPDRLEQRRRRLQSAFERVVDTAIARRVDLFLHAGDLYDRPDPRNAERRFVATQLRRLRDAGIPVFAIAGNHDSPRSYGYDGGVTPHEEMEELGAVCLFRSTRALEAESLTVRGVRVGIRGMTSDFNLPPNRCPLADCADGLERAGDVDLVLLHYGVEAWAQPWAEEPCLLRSNLDRLNADAVCVGHLHTRAEARLAEGGLLLNPGATEHIHFGDEHLECGCWLLHLQPGRVDAEYVRLTPQPMRTLTVELDKGAGEPTRHILDRMDAVSAPDQLLRVRLTGTAPAALLEELDLAAIQTAGAERNFQCQVDTDSLVSYEPGADVFVEIGFSFDVRDELQKTAEAFARNCGDDETRRELCRLAGQELTASCDRYAGR